VCDFLNENLLQTGRKICRHTCFASMLIQIRKHVLSVCEEGRQFAFNRRRDDGGNISSRSVHLNTKFVISLYKYSIDKGNVKEALLSVKVTFRSLHFDYTSLTFKLMSRTSVCNMHIYTCLYTCVYAWFLVKFSGLKNQAIDPGIDS
jgi:hypothetical protein